MFDTHSTEWSKTILCFMDVMQYANVAYITMRLAGAKSFIIWTDTGLLFIGFLGTIFRDIWIKILTFSFKKIHWKISSAKWWPFCFDLNVLYLFMCNWSAQMCYHISGSGWLKLTTRKTNSISLNENFMPPRSARKHIVYFSLAIVFIICDM